MFIVRHIVGEVQVGRNPFCSRQGRSSHSREGSGGVAAAGVNVACGARPLRAVSGETVNIIPATSNLDHRKYEKNAYMNIYIREPMY